jgi:hypothetical protein
MTKSLFGRTRSVAGAAGILSVFENVKSHVAREGGRIVDAQAAEGFLAIESLDAGSRSNIDAAATNLGAALKGFTQAAGLKTVAISASNLGDTNTISMAQEHAALTAAVKASNPRAALGARVQNAATLRLRFASESLVEVFGHEGMSGAMEAAPSLEAGRLASEAYDERENKNTVAYAVAYNLGAARQDEFAEAFYPTVTLTPDNVGYSVSVTLNLLQDEVRRAVTGALSSFNRINVLSTITDPTLLRSDQTRLIPIVRTGGATDSTASFVASTDVAPYTVTQEKAPVTTAPLKPGVQLELLGLCQTDAQLAAGVADQTEAIDSAMLLTAVYIKTTVATNTTAVFKVDVSRMLGATFNAAVQGNSRTLNLNMATDEVRIVSTTSNAAGNAVAQLSALSTNTVRLGFTAFGSVTQDTGVTVLNFTPVTIRRVSDSTGLDLSTASGAGATIAALFADATVIGYDLLGYRTNSNRAQRGQLVDTQHLTRAYTTPYLPPITALRPVGQSDADDQSIINSLLNLTRIRTSQAAITELFAAISALTASFDPTNSLDNQPKLGISSYLVKNRYISAAIDAQADLNSLVSSDRPANLEALLINVLRDIVYRLYRESAFKPAMESLSGGMGAPKPLVIIGTDPTIHRYLTLAGDTRTLGDGFEFKVVSTLDPRMAGKIIVSFGTEQAYGSGDYHPLHHGSMSWSPEVPVMMPMTRNGRLSYELTVSPRFRHVTHLYVMGQVTVTNITAAMSTKIAVDTNQV